MSFLGVGTIIVTHDYSVKGLTTAAGLWVSGIIGLCAGAGFFEGAFIAAALVLLTEGGLALIKESIRKSPVFTVEVLASSKEALDRVMRCFKNYKITITNIRIIAADAEKGNYYLAFFTLRSLRSLDRKKVYEEVASIEGIKEFTEVEDLDES